MPLQLVTAPALEPVTVAEARAHLRVDGASAEPAPAVAPSAALAGAGAGNVDDGAHRYRVTFVTSAGETEGGVVSAAVTVADKTVDGQVSLTDIPLGGSLVTSRKVYRTEAGGADYKLLATIADNTTTSYTDNTADAGLGAGAPTTNTTQDPTVSRLITTSRRLAERYTRRAFVTQTWNLVLDCFPPEIEMPLPPLQSIGSVQYVDTDGATQTLASSGYQVDTTSERGRVRPAWQEVWPSTRAVFNAVTIAFTAGYGDPADVPSEIRDAILLILGRLYDHRGDEVDVEDFARIPPQARSLLSPYRSQRF